jgi:hypothetical protein
VLAKSDAARPSSRSVGVLARRVSPLVRSWFARTFASAYADDFADDFGARA